MTEIFKRSLAVIIPVFNNAGTLKELAERLISTLERLTPKLNYHFVFVDDGSSDHSASVLSDLAKRHTQVTIIFLSKNFGQKYAIACGLDFAETDLYLFLDADLEENPEWMIKVLDPILNGTADISIGVIPQLKKKRYSSIIFHYFVSKLYKKKRISGYLPTTMRAFTSKVRYELMKYTDISYDYGTIFNIIGFTQVEVKLDEVPVRKKTNYRLYDRIILAAQFLSYNLEKAVLFSVGFFSLFSMINFAYLMYLIIQRISSASETQHNLTLIFTINILTLSILGLVSSIIIYLLALNTVETRKRPKYHIKSLIQS